MSETKYPECEKLAALRNERSTICDFLEWLGERGMFLCRYENDSQLPWPISASADELAMKYLGIDPVKLEQERRAMLAEFEATGEV